MGFSEGYEVDIGIIGHILKEGHFTLVAFGVKTLDVGIYYAW